MAPSREGFVHSVPVPRIYKIAAKISRNVKEGKNSIKNLIYQEKHVNIKALYALVVESFKKEGIIEGLLEKTQLLVKEPRFDPWLAKILIWEMLWGNNKMQRESKPVRVLLGYQDQFKEILATCSIAEKEVLKHNVLKPRYARVNTLKVTMAEAISNFRDEGWSFQHYLDKTDYDGFLKRMNNLAPCEFMTDLHIPDLLIFPPKTEFHQHEAFKSRKIILQDKASCLPVHLLNPTPGSIVMDMCAAPGMKTTQLAAMIKDTGTVHAFELDENRKKLLSRFVTSTGATCVKTKLKDVMKVTSIDCPGVEYILVDPSCSGSGITDRIEVEVNNIPDNIERLKKLCSFQAKLLRHAVSSFPEAKRIVYSTCSLNSEENEDVVRQVLETCKNFKLIDAKKLLKSWNMSGSEVFPELGQMCVYASPEKDKTNGFFIAVLERLEDGEKNPYLNYELCKMFEKKHRKSEGGQSQEIGKNNEQTFSKKGKRNKKGIDVSMELIENASKVKGQEILNNDRNLPSSPIENELQVQKKIKS